MTVLDYAIDYLIGKGIEDVLLSRLDIRILSGIAPQAPG